MTEILLLRHGKSDWNQPVDDIDRPLTERGKHDAQRMGAWLGSNDLLPARVVSSPARRALETAEKCVKAAGLTAAMVQVDARLYEASHQVLHQVLDEQTGQADRILLVGHNPGLDMLLEDLIEGPLPRTVNGKLMTTASLAQLRLIDADSQASLLRLVRPGDVPLRYAYQGTFGPAFRDRPDYYYRQSAVIPVRQRDGKIEVLMIAKTGGKKWSLPKGIVEPGMSPADSAAKEALEEAGVLGTPRPDVVGNFELAKWGGTCLVEVFAMPVDSLLPAGHWESHKRVRRWFPLAEAVEKCRYPALAVIIGRLESSQ